jgi:hypothetical protein
VLISSLQLRYANIYIIIYAQEKGVVIWLGLTGGCIQHYALHPQLIKSLCVMLMFSGQMVFLVGALGRDCQ